MHVECTCAPFCTYVKSIGIDSRNAGSLARKRNMQRAAIIRYCRRRDSGLPPPPHSSNRGRKLTWILFRERHVQLTYLPVSCCCVVWFQLWTTKQCRLANALYQTRYTFIPRHYITHSIHSISFYEFTYN